MTYCICRGEPRLRRASAFVKVGLEPSGQERPKPLIRNSLSREIAAVLIFKALFLTALYFAFFAEPKPTALSGLFAPVAGDAGRGGAP